MMREISNHPSGETLVHPSGMISPKMVFWWLWVAFLVCIFVIIAIPVAVVLALLVPILLVGAMIA